MKITFLGTSHGVPAPDRHCSSTMLEVNGTRYLIDGGAPVADILTTMGVPFESVRAVFTTHSHSDHVYGLAAFCSLCSWFYKKADLDVYFTEQAVPDAFGPLMVLGGDKFDADRVRFHVIAPDFVYRDENICVTAIPTDHIGWAGCPSYAYLIEAEGKRLVFTGDLRNRDAADFPAVAKNEPTDLIVSELAHFGAEVLFPILDGCPTKQVLINHVGFGPHFENIAKAVADGRFAFPLRAVADGDVVEL